MLFISGESNVKEEPHSWWSCTTVTPSNEEHLDQLIYAIWQIMTVELSTELDIGFSVLEIIVATLKYLKFCAFWVLQMLTY